jgi:hypothetical protein
MMTTIEDLREGMVWGLRTSFVRYARSAGGTVEALGAALLTEDDRFVFPLETDVGGVRRYAGGMRITAYGGLIDIEIHNPWIHHEPALMTAVVKNTIAGRAIVTQLDFSSSFLSAETRLDAQSAVIFDFRYPAGERLDDIEFVLLSDDGSVSASSSSSVLTGRTVHGS